MRRLRAARWHLLAAALAVVFLVPIYYMLVASLRLPGSPPPPVPEAWPAERSLQSYRLLFDLLPLGSYLLNSLTIASVLVPGATLVAVLAGYALARLDTRAARFVLGLTAMALFVPLTGLLLGRFVIFSSLGLTDTFLPLWALSTVGGTPFFVLVYYWSFRQQPADMADAAQLDGAGPLQAWMYVAMPLAGSTTAVVAALAFVLAWGAFLEPLVYLLDESLFPAALAIAAMRNVDPQNVPILMAAAAVVAVPPIIVFAFAQRAIDALAYRGGDAQRSR